MHGTFKTIETKPDPFSLDTLIDWLEKQPADKEYCFFDNGGCMFFQYFEAMGIRVYSVGGDYYRTERAGDCNFFPANFISIAPTHPYTFGAALNRARAALSS